MAKFPERARVVIIGQGGIVGASVVHHLIERGWDNIVSIDKSGIRPTSGRRRTRRTSASHDARPAVDLHHEVQHRLLRKDGSLRPHRRPGSGPRRRRRTHGGAQAPRGLEQGLRQPGGADHRGRGQGPFSAARRKHDPGRPVGPGRGPGQAALTDGGRRTGGRGGGFRQAAVVCEHLVHRAAHGQRPHRGRGNHQGFHRGGLCRGVRRPVGPADRGHGRRRPAHHAGRPPAHLLQALPGIRRHRQGHRLPAAARPGQLGLPARHRRPQDARGRPDRMGLLRREEPAHVPPRATCSKRKRPASRRRSATWSSIRSWRRWSAPSS